MTTAAKFPAVALALTDVFGELPNFPPLTLNGAINASVTSIVVNEAIPATWPQASWITVDSEVMRVTSYNAGTKTFTVAARDGSAGNAQSTTAATHASGAYLFVALTAQQWNQVVAEVIAIETQLGVNLGAAGDSNRTRYVFNGLMTPSEITLVGTGTTSIPAVGTYRRFSTGATSASSAAVRQLMRNTANFSIGVVRRAEIVLDFVSIDANTTAYVFLTTESVTGAPSLTANHIGIKNIAGAISFTTADGATEQTTVITSFITAARDHTYVVTSDGTTVRLFIDGTVRATHATNVPVSTMTANAVWRAYIVNAAAADKIMDIHSIDVLFATS